MDMHFKSPGKKFFEQRKPWRPDTKRFDYWKGVMEKRQQERAATVSAIKKEMMDYIANMPHYDLKALKMPLSPTIKKAIGTLIAGTLTAEEVREIRNALNLNITSSFGIFVQKARELGLAIKSSSRTHYFQIDWQTEEKLRETFAWKGIVDKEFEKEKSKLRQAEAVELNIEGRVPTENIDKMQMLIKDYCWTFEKQEHMLSVADRLPISKVGTAVRHSSIVWHEGILRHEIDKIIFAWQTAKKMELLKGEVVSYITDMDGFGEQRNDWPELPEKISAALPLLTPAQMKELREFVVLKANKDFAQLIVQVKLLGLGVVVVPKTYYGYSEDWFSRKDMERKFRARNMRPDQIEEEIGKLQDAEGIWLTLNGKAASENAAKILKLTNEWYFRLQKQCRLVKTMREIETDGEKDGHLDASWLITNFACSVDTVQAWAHKVINNW